MVGHLDCTVNGRGRTPRLHSTRQTPTPRSLPWTAMSCLWRFQDIRTAQRLIRWSQITRIPTFGMLASKILKAFLTGMPLTMNWTIPSRSFAPSRAIAKTRCWWSVVATPLSLQSCMALGTSTSPASISPAPRFRRWSSSLTGQEWLGILSQKVKKQLSQLFDFPWSPLAKDINGYKWQNNLLYHHPVVC